MCNDNLGCADESDEEPVLCNRTIPVQPVGEGECRLPRAPANGRISIIGCENTPFEEICQAGSGFPVGQYISVRFECNRGYTLRGEASSTCIDGKWEPQVPVCQLVSESDGDACPPLRSKTLDIQCKDKDGNTVSCNNRVPVGSTASFQCREGYTQPIFPYDQIECRSPGTWSSSLLSCLPDCGTPVPEGELYVVNGQQAEVGEFPWHAAIYIRRRNNQWDFWCGGSLISNEGTVLSAAHCFWDRALKKPASADKFRISLGRYHRDWGTKDRYVQERSVRRIVIHERYQDFSNNYAADIAIVFLEDPITLGNAVRPVCIDWRRLLTREALSDGNIGAVAGWGETETGKPSDTLQSARLPYIEYRKCIEAVPPGFKPLVTPDKFCAGYLNGTSVCKGDSGGGLAFQSNDHWYVQGIVSVGVKNGLTCDHNQYTVFTQVSEHIEFLRKELTSSSNVGKPTWD